MSQSVKDKSNNPGFQGSTVRQLAKILKETDLTEIEYEVGDSRIRVARNVAQTQLVSMGTPIAGMPAAIPAPSHETSNAVSSNAAQTAQTPETPPAQDPSSHPGTIKSPMVGTAYLSPSPDDPTFVQVGNDVSEGDTLMIVEAMKVMNPIRAPRSGKVTSVLVQNAEPVEFDQPLMIIE